MPNIAMILNNYGNLTFFIFYTYSRLKTYANIYSYMSKSHRIYLNDSFMVTCKIFLCYTITFEHTGVKGCLAT